MPFVTDTMWSSPKECSLLFPIYHYTVHTTLTCTVLYSDYSHGVVKTRFQFTINQTIQLSQYVPQYRMQQCIDKDDILG